MSNPGVSELLANVVNIINSTMLSGGTSIQTIILSSK